VQEIDEANRSVFDELEPKALVGRLSVRVHGKRVPKSSTCEGKRTRTFSSTVSPRFAIRICGLPHALRARHARKIPASLGRRRGRRKRLMCSRAAGKSGRAEKPGLPESTG
jgi:hypothetical protein